MEASSGPWVKSSSQRPLRSIGFPSGSKTVLDRVSNPKALKCSDGTAAKTTLIGFVLLIIPGQDQKLHVFVKFRFYDKSYPYIQFLTSTGLSLGRNIRNVGRPKTKVPLIRPFEWMSNHVFGTGLGGFWGYLRIFLDGFGAISGSKKLFLKNL